MSEDFTCAKCHAPKPEIAYPQNHGARVGRVCKACQGQARAHHVRPTRSMALRAREAARKWSCQSCGKSYPNVYPNNWGRIRPAVTFDPTCRGCAVRERRARA